MESEEGEVVFVSSTLPLTLDLPKPTIFHKKTNLTEPSHHLVLKLLDGRKAFDFSH